jgi:hypothetical protein
MDQARRAGDGETRRMGEGEKGRRGREFLTCPTDQYNIN